MPPKRKASTRRSPRRNWRRGRTGSLPSDPSMRLITFSVRGTGSPRIGVRVARQVLDLAAAAGVAGEPAPPARMKDLLAAGDPAMKRVRRLSAEADADREGVAAALLDERELRYLP